MRELRISLAITLICLLCVGVVMIYSASGIYALQVFKDKTYFLKRHLVFLVLGFGAMWAVMMIDYRVLQKWAKPMLLAGILMLVLVLIPGVGRESFGARRWFSLGFLNFQPSEFAKLAMIIYAADFLTRKQKEIRSFLKGFMPLMLLLGVHAVLIIKQPDLGSTVSIGTITLVMLFIAGARLSHLALIGAMAVPALAYLIIAAPYRLARIMAFLDPWEDSQGIGFQLTQSQIALGSGGLFGLGLGQSQQKLFYLPAAHTDFILSIIGEEFGLLGTTTVICLFISFIWIGARIARKTNNPFGYFLAIGILTMFGMQAVVNVGVSIGALPTKGLPLPFISYGGSALVFHMMAVGLLLNISRTEDL